MSTSRKPIRSAALSNVEAGEDRKDAIVDSWVELLSVADAPAFTVSNTHVRTGYRAALSLRLCAASIFRIHNETGNIWSHLVSFVVVVLAALKGLPIITEEGWTSENMFITLYCVSGLVCFLLSTAMHTFYCHSMKACARLTKLDHMGVALVMCASFFPSLYYGYQCLPNLLCLYLSAIAVGFAVVAAAALSHSSRIQRLRVGIFIGFGAFGVVPVVHWVWLQGLDHPEVQLEAWRLFVMFLLLGAGAGVYLAQIPERWWPGKFDYLGHSHQWWHLLVSSAFFWHMQSLYFYHRYRDAHPCAPEPLQSPVAK